MRYTRSTDSEANNKCGEIWCVVRCRLRAVLSLWVANLDLDRGHARRNAFFHVKDVIVNGNLRTARFANFMGHEPFS